MSTDETYNGWTNRETWALALHVNNDQGLQETVHEMIREGWTAGHFSADQPQRAGEIVQEYFDGLWADILEDPNMRSRDLLMMFGDIGSTYRIDWAEIGRSFLADAIEGTDSSTCVHCGRSIVLLQGTWSDPRATGDDSTWRETCDENEAFTAEHEPTA